MITFDPIQNSLRFSPKLALVRPSSMETEYIKNRIAGGIKALQRRMVSDVDQICRTILIPLAEEFEERDLSEELSERLRGYFRDIYWSLKVHLMFHLGIANENDEVLRAVGVWGGLTDEQMNVLPDQNCAIDPGSKLLEMVSRQPARKIHKNIG